MRLYGSFGSLSFQDLRNGLSGSLSGEALCDDYQEWTYTFDTSPFANGSEFNVSVVLNENGENLTSPENYVYTIDRYINIDSPAENLGIGPTVNLHGYCNIENATVQISGAVTATTTCDGYEWSVASAFVSGTNASTVTIHVKLYTGATLQDQDSRSFTLYNEPPTVTISGAPTGESSLTSVSLTFAGADVSKFKYKFGNSDINCASPDGYSAENTAPKSQSLNLTSLLNGPIVVCAVGKSSLNGLWQSYNNATQVSWIKDGDVYVNFLTKATASVEGTSNITLNISLTGTKNFDTKVYYTTLGKGLYMIDHNLNEGYVTIPANTLAASITFSTFENVLLDGDRNLNIFFTHTDKPTVLLGTTNTIQHLILDNDGDMKSLKKFVNGSGTGCAIYSDDRLFCWGSNNSGQLGLGHKNTIDGIVEVMPGETFKDISLGGGTVCAITAANKLKCWGQWGDWQDKITTLDVTPINSGVDYVSVGFTVSNMVALTADGKIHYWYGSRIHRAHQELNYSAVFTELKAHYGGVYFCAKDTDSKLWCYRYWGAMWNGESVNLPRYLPVRRQ